MKEIDEEEDQARALHLKLEQAANRKQELLNQRKERAASCCQLKHARQFETEKLKTALELKMEMAERRRASALLGKIQTAMRSAKIKRRSDFVMVKAETSNDQLKSSLEASLAQNRKMILEIAELKSEQKTLKNQLIQANSSRKTSLETPKKAMAWVIQNTLPAFYETKTSSSTVDAKSKERPTPQGSHQDSDSFEIV